MVNGATTFWSTDLASTALFFGTPTEYRNGQEVRFRDAGDSNYVGFKAPALTANQIWTLPDSDGSSGQVLYTSGTGLLSWKDNEESKKAWNALGSPVSADTPINISAFTNPDGLGFGTSASAWEKNYDVYVNGIMQLNGQDAASNNDVYYVSSATIAFEYDLKAGDIVQIIQRK